MANPFDPLETGRLTLKNRLVMAPIKTAFGAPDGQVTDRVIAYFRRRAVGGVGLIISEPLYVARSGAEHPKQLGIDGDDRIDGLRRLVSAIHEGGAKVFAHLNHAGRAANPKASGEQPLAPSRVTCGSTGVEPRELGETQIRELVQAHAEAARRAKAAGFDGLELQFGLGYLVAQFLSPATNLRDDGYGGDPERRRRFASEVFAAVREAAGDALPISVRVSASEQTPKGLKLDDAKDLARHLETWGADLLHVVTGTSCEAPPWYFQHMVLPPGVNESLAAELGREVDLPVMAAGRLGDPTRIRSILAEREIDLVALGRPLIADADLPNKLRRHRDDEVLLCGHCLQGCLAGVKSGQGLGCNINPWVGQEAAAVEPAPRPKHVVVVGGGPAGIQASLTARQRGHRVTLFEKDQLGGNYRLAYLPPGKKRIEPSLRSMIRQLDLAGVELSLHHEATSEEVKALEPDAVIVATGATSATLDIPGLGEVLTARDVLTNGRDTGDRVLVLGGGMIGMEVAEFLASRGSSCTVLVRRDKVARDMDPLSRKLMLKRIPKLPIEILMKTQLRRIEEGRAVVVQEGQERDLGSFDSVVMTVGVDPYDPISADLRESGYQVHVIGDAEQPGNVHQAVTSGHRVALEL